jgi:phage shock protein PspC (stress-responsive transcriptional regulator)
MTTTPPDAPSGPPPGPTGDHGPRVDRDQVRDLGRLRRSRADRKVAGVAGGLGRHLDIDPLILRVAFVVLVFFGGAGLIVYAACWLLVPEDGSDRGAIHLDERSRTFVLVGVGVIAALAMIGDSWGGGWFPWPLAVIALVALWLLTRNNPPSPGAPPAAPYGETYSTTYPPVAPAQDVSHAAAPPPDFTTYPPQPPVWTPPPAPLRPSNPRKRGPILFWFTLALLALSLGVLGIVDLAGADIADPAYPALAVGICGLMLVVGAFFGRAGGIIALGLAATVGLTAATVADQWDGEQILASPTTAASVDDRYEVDAGEIVLDLRNVSNLDDLDGRTINLEAGIGQIEVILPAGLSAEVAADVDGPGNIVLFGEEHGGIEIDRTGSVGTGEPAITINAQLGVGQIEVRR